MNEPPLPHLVRNKDYAESNRQKPNCFLLFLYLIGLVMSLVPFSVIFRILSQGMPSDVMPLIAILLCATVGGMVSLASVIGIILWLKDREHFNVE